MRKGFLTNALLPITFTAILGANHYTALSVTNRCALQRRKVYLLEKVLIRSQSFTIGLMMS